MTYLLDTCVLSELVKKKPNGGVVEWLEQQEELSLYLSVITFGELQKGISKLVESRRRKKLQDWVDQDLASRFAGRILDVGRRVAARWGELSGEAEKIGRKVPVLDGLLAGDRPRRRTDGRDGERSAFSRDRMFLLQPSEALTRALGGNQDIREQRCPTHVHIAVDILHGSSRTLKELSTP